MYAIIVEFSTFGHLQHVLRCQCMQRHKMLITVKPLLFACPLFRKFRESKKTAKLNDTNIDTIPTLISFGVENLQLAHHQTKGCSLFVYAYTGSNTRVMR